MKKQTKKKKKKRSKKIQSKSRPRPIYKSNSGSIGEEKGNRALQAVSKREREEGGKEKGAISKYFNLATQFLREAKIELKKVKWPTRKELLASTAMVIFLVLFVALYLGLVDQGLIFLIKKIVG